MPNGLTKQKPKPEVDYKPYRPRPRYSADDFELDGMEDEPKYIVKKLVVPAPQVAPMTAKNGKPEVIVKLLFRQPL